VPPRSDYGTGCYRRAIRVRCEGDAVVGDLADDFHHFAVRVRHDGAAVTEVSGDGVRVPWTTCPGALEPLRRMEGVALSQPLLQLVRHTPAREQCTHWHDVACLAIVHAWRALRGGNPVRRYDVELADRVDGETPCAIRRDERPLFVWRVRGLQIVDGAGSAFTGLQIGRPEFREALATQSDPDLQEAIWVLYRAAFIGLGRRWDFDQLKTAAEFSSLAGACHTFSPERMADARRIRGTVRDFTERPDALLPTTKR